MTVTNPLSGLGQARCEKKVSFVVEEALFRRTDQHHVITKLYPLGLLEPCNS